MYSVISAKNRPTLSPNRYNRHPPNGCTGFLTEQKKLETMKWLEATLVFLVYLMICIGLVNYTGCRTFEHRAGTGQTLKEI